MASKTESQFLTAVSDLLNIVDSIDDQEGKNARQQAVKAALERYSNDKPEETIDDFTGDGGVYYDLTSTPVITGFVDGFSRVTRIEYPAQAVSADHTPTMLEPEDWDDAYWAGGVRYLRFPHHTPASTETVRVTFTTPYAFSSGSVTIPAQDYQAIVHLAAGLACEYYATRYSRSNDATISVDSVDHMTRAQQFSSRAREFFRLYEEHLGLGEEAGPYTAAGEFVDWDTMPGYPAGRGYMFHGRYSR